MSKSLILVGAVALMVLLWHNRPQHQVVEGVVMTLTPEGVFAVANEQTDPTGVRFVLVPETKQDGGAIRSGARVRVWYRIVGDEQKVADRVLVLDEPLR